MHELGEDSPSADSSRPKRLALTLPVLLVLALPAVGQAPAGLSEAIEIRLASHLEEAKRAESVQNYLAAAAQYKAILELRPEWPLIHQSLGVTYHLAKHYSQAIEHLQRAVELDDQLWGAFLFLGMDYYQIHQFEDAAEALEKSLALNPKIAETSRWLGMSRAALHNYEAAILHLLQVTAVNAEDIEALFHLARAYDSRASQLFQAIGDKNPQSPFVYLLQSERLASEGDLPRARAEYRRALDLRPDLAGILDQLGLTATTQGLPGVQRSSANAELRSSFIAGRYGDVIRQVKQILDSQPEDDESIYWLGRTYKRLAGHTLDRLAEVAPESYRVDQLAGELHEEETEYGNAVEAYRRALAKAPEVPGLRYAIGAAYWKMGRFEDAQEWLAKELDRNPHHARARYRLGNLLLDRGRPKEAISHLEQALATATDLPEARFDLGRAYLEDQQYAAAAAELKATVRVDPTNERAHYLLGNAYRGLGRMDDARQHLQTYQELSRQRLRKVQQDVKSVTEDVNREAP